MEEEKNNDVNGILGETASEEQVSADLAALNSETPVETAPVEAAPVAEPAPAPVETPVVPEAQTEVAPQVIEANSENLQQVLDNTMQQAPAAPVYIVQKDNEDVQRLEQELKEAKEENKKVRTLIKRITGFLMVALFVVWGILLYHDYDNIKKGSKPDFCIFGEEKTKEKLGTTVTYKCLGYKVVTYKTEDASMTEFIPLWQENKKLSEINK